MVTLVKTMAGIARLECIYIAVWLDEESGSNALPKGSYFPRAEKATSLTTMDDWSFRCSIMSTRLMSDTRTLSRVMVLLRGETAAGWYAPLVWRGVLP